MISSLGQPRVGAFPSSKCHGALQFYHETLLLWAEWLIEENKYSLAIVTARMACEFYTERMFLLLLKNSRGKLRNEVTTEGIKNYNLANRKVADLYFSLTGDDITGLPFWGEFKRLIGMLRNEIVHSGCVATREEAEESCRVVRSLIEHLQKQSGDEK